MAALTLYPTNTAAVTVAASNTIATVDPNSSANGTVTNFARSVTGYKEINSQSNNATAQVAGTPTLSTPAPSGNGWLLDNTTLEGATINSGNWSGTGHVSVTPGTVTVTLYHRIFKRSSGGIYTGLLLLPSNSTSITLGSTVAFTIPSTAGGSFALSTGDKLYVDVIMNVTVADSSPGTPNITYVRNASSSLFIATPGYTPGAVVLLSRSLMGVGS